MGFRLVLWLMVAQLAMIFPADASHLPVEVSFATADGGEIYADLYGQGVHGVVLAHGAAFDKESWRPLAERLAAHGDQVLAIDFRGYGKSRAGSKPGGLDEDVLAAVRYLRGRGEKTVAVIGASMGGGAAARAATEARPGEINRLILLSPVPIDDPEQLHVGSVLFIASRNEGLVAAVQAQYRRAPDPKQLLLLDGSAHAQHIFRTAQAGRLTAAILRFLGR